MALSQQLQAVLTSNQAPSPFTVWLTNAGVFTVAQFVLAARGDLQHVEAELILGSTIQLNLAEKVAIRQAWSVAEQIYRREVAATAASEAAPDSAPISMTDLGNLHAAFDNEHRFRIPAKRLLDETLLGRLLKETTANPKRLRFIPPEQLRLSTSASLPVASTLSLYNGNLATSEIMGPEDCRDSIELFRRIRALVNSLSLVTIHTPDWLPYMAGGSFR